MLSRRFSIRFVLSASGISKITHIATDMEILSCHLTSFIWINALYINQNDLQERASQVSLMVWIYSQARTVAAWLGGEDKVSLDPLPLMIAPGQISQRQPELIKKLKTMKMPDPATSRLLGYRQISIPEWSNLFYLLNRSWFKRAWVVQAIGGSKCYQFGWLKSIGYRCASKHGGREN